MREGSLFFGRREKILRTPSRKRRAEKTRPGTEEKKREEYKEEGKEARGNEWGEERSKGV